MSFCTRIATIPGAAPSPVFNSISTASQAWSSDISFSNIGKLEAFLNSLDIGTFSVTKPGADYLITTDCNEIEFTSITVDDSTINFVNSLCQDAPCVKCEENCFDNLIALRDVCMPKQACIFLNELGISRHTLEQILTKDYSGPEDFFQKQYDNAVSETARTIHGYFAEKYLVNSILEGERLGFIQDNKTVKASNNKFGGILAELINSNSFLDFYVSGLTLFTDYTGLIQVNVYDVFTGNVIDKIVVNSVAGKESTIRLDDIYKSKRKGMKLFFAYDTTGINSYKTLIRNGICCGRTTFSNQYIYSGGAYSNAGIFIKSDLKNADHTFGMSLTYSLQCNHQDWLCSHKNLIALPMAYRLAANITQFGLNASPSQRVNTKVTINKEEMNNSLAWYESKFNETLQSILSNVQTPTDAKCFQCKRAHVNKFVPA